MGVLGAIVRPQSLLMRAGQAKVPERRSIGAELVGGQQFRGETQFPQELAHQPERRPPVASALNQHIEDLTLMIDGAPQVHPPAGDPDHHLVEMPSLARSGTAPPQVSCNHGTEFHHPAPHCFVRYIERALGQELLDVAVAQRKAQIQPDRVLDNRRREAVSAIRDRAMPKL
jgi:hypothetical protein